MNGNGDSDYHTLWNTYMEVSNMYKLVLSDLDETLLVNHHVPEVNVKAIEKAQKQGVKFVPCTGRAQNMIYEIQKEIGIYQKEEEYSICFNGGLIIENKNDRILYFNGLGYERAKRLFDIANHYDVCVLIFTLDCCYIFHADPNEIQRKKDQKANFKVIDNYNMDFLKEDKIAKLLIEKRDMDYLKVVESEIRNQFDDVSFTFSSNRYLECNALGVDKGKGLKWLADYLNIDIEDTAAIGDNYNDIEMIEAAGLGACVSSSSDDIKKRSNVVLKKDYFEGAVAELIEEYILEE